MAPDPEPHELVSATPARRRSLIPGLAIAGALVAAAYLAAPPSRLPIRCGTTVAPGADTVVMLSASWCGYCRRARAFLQDEHIAHCEYDIETTARGRELFARIPLKVIPVLMIRDDILVGFNRDEIRQSLTAHGIIDFAD